MHRHTARQDRLARRFKTDAEFFSLRLEPYLLATAQRHPALADRLQWLCAQTAQTQRVLVHGDISPKNILCGPQGPVFLDAECAWYGDPAFDLAFCLNHLLLKAVHLPAQSSALGQSFVQLAQAYLGAVDWEPVAAFEQRAAQLLPALLLARVDGKSPVEYLTDEGRREVVRRAATQGLRQPPRQLSEVLDVTLKELLP
jgi:aminoglycoside phosphotransferase (APT) family kinase protein